MKSKLSASSNKNRHLILHIACLPTYSRHLPAIVTLVLPSVSFRNYHCGNINKY